MRLTATLIAIIICQISFGQIPSLTVSNNEQKQDLQISQLAVDVNIVGNIATTTFDITFHNSFSRDLEGELSMPLGDGQEICRYALEINGKLREGVVVDKIKARQTFEAVVRQKIDPGIINITKGNFFNTKIFPIPANGEKRVVLALSQTLKGDSENLYYSLPIEKSKKIGEFKLDVKVIKNQSEEKNILSEFENIKFDSNNDAYCLNFQRKNFTASSPLKFTIPRFVKTDHQLFTCDFEGETYFYLNIKSPKLSKTTKKAPEKITIFWDNSFSASDRDIDKELNLLDSYLTSLKGVKNVSLITFNQKTNTPKTFKINNDVTKITDYIKKLNNDGATCLDNIKFDNNCDEILFFSDAINTIGEENTEIPNVPIYAITSSTGSNYTLLKKLALKSNGEFINLNTVTIEKALQIMQINEEKFLSCDYNNSEIQETYPNIARRVGEHFEVAGVLKAKMADLKINYGSKNGVTQTQSFKIHKNSNTPVSRIWASKKIEAMGIDYEKNKKNIHQLGKKFGVVTRNTAFIVLDRIEDYVEHEIVPPEELKIEYFRLLANKEKPQGISPKTIERENINRAENLKYWYKSTSHVSKINKNAGELEEIEITIQDEEEVGMETGYILSDRQKALAQEIEQNISPPPPPERLADIADLEKETDIFLEEVAVSLASEYPPPPLPILEEMKALNLSDEEIDIYSEEIVTFGESRRDVTENFIAQYNTAPVIAREGNAPTTRQQIIARALEQNISPPPPPPPPPNVPLVLNLIDDDYDEIEEGLEISDYVSDEMENSEEEDEYDDAYYEKNKSVSEPNTKSSIKVLAWLPDAPYMKELRKTDSAKFDTVYFKLKKENKNRPSFYIQVADLLFQKNMKEKAVRVLSNTLELDLENPELLKVVARRLLLEGEYETAIKIFKEIKELRPEEPQSFRDLALAYVENKQYQEALDMYKHILDNNWDRFEDIKDVVLNELNCLIIMHKDKLYIKTLNPDYINPMPLNVRIVLDWSSNENDIDLWVVDPNGEKCKYDHRNTEIGGKISHDFTRGYGPEEFSLKNAERGTYVVYVNYFSESRQTITGPVTVYATLFTNYGTAQQKAKYITVQLTDNKETRQVGQLEFEN